MPKRVWILSPPLRLSTPYRNGSSGDHNRAGEGQRSGSGSFFSRSSRPRSSAACATGRPSFQVVICGEVRIPCGTVVLELRLNDHLRCLDPRRHLNALNHRIIAEDQADVVKIPRGPFDVSTTKCPPAVFGTTPGMPPHGPAIGFHPANGSRGSSQSNRPSNN